MTNAERKLIDNAIRDKALFIEKGYPLVHYNNCRFMLFTSDEDKNILRAYVVTRRGQYPAMESVKFCKKMKIKDIYFDEDY